MTDKMPMRIWVSFNRNQKNCGSWHDVNVDNWTQQEYIHKEQFIEWLEGEKEWQGHHEDYYKAIDTVIEKVNSDE